MAKKYLDENGLAYFWSKVKQYLATPTRAGLMSPTDKAKVDAITNQGTIAYYKKIEGSYTTVSTGEDTIPIPITSYSTADILLVDINGLDLVEGVDYTVSGTNIVLATPISVAGQTIHFIALRATTATSADYSILKGDDGDVSDVLVDGNSVVNQQGIANISIQSLGLIDVFYPVGSYYETSDTTFDPNTAWGGTWVSISGATLSTNTAEVIANIVSFNINRARASHVSVTAPNVAGYTFVFWAEAATNGWVGGVYPAAPTSQTSDFWVETSDGNSTQGNVRATAVYRKNKTNVIKWHRTA